MAMLRGKLGCLIIAISVIVTSIWANSPPEVSNVSASQRTDGSGIVDIYYTLSDAGGDNCTISLIVSDDGGGSYSIIPSSSALTGDIGANISPGSRHIVWNSKIDLPGSFGTNHQTQVAVDDNDGPDGMVWVYINDPGVPSHEGFNGQMSKYETTNAQYCAYLNSAEDAGQITVYGNHVYASSDTSHSHPYYNLAGPGVSADDATNGGAARITYNGQTFSVDGGFNNHPVTYVSWHGATAFCNYYGYRLPTEWEWQAVADYHGEFNYGCGMSINNSIANYWGTTHPNGTTDVGCFGAYGYGMCDMAGNVWERTDSIFSGSNHVLRGGCWANTGDICTVWYRHHERPTHHAIGFRVCR